MAKRSTVNRAPTRKPTHHHHDRELHTLEHVIAFILELETQIMANDARVTAALDAQDAKIADLSTKVDAFIASHQGQSEADVAELVGRVNAQGAAVDAVAAKLV